MSLMKLFFPAVIPSVVDMEAALGVDQVVVVFPVVVLKAVLQIADGMTAGKKNFIKNLQ